MHEARSLAPLLGVLLASTPAAAAPGDELARSRAGLLLLEEAPSVALARSPAGLELRKTGNLAQCFDGSGAQVGVDGRDVMPTDAALPLRDGTGFVAFGPIFPDTSGGHISIARFDCRTGWGEVRQPPLLSILTPQGGRVQACQLPVRPMEVAIDADGRAFFTEGSRLCTFHEESDAFEVLLDDAAIDALLAPRVDPMLAALGLGPLVGGDGFSWGLRSLLVAPDGSLWTFTSLTYMGNPVEAVVALLRRAPDGTWSLAGGLEPADELATATLSRSYTTPWLWLDDATGLLVSGVFTGPLDETLRPSRAFLSVRDPAAAETPPRFVELAGFALDLRPTMAPSGVMQFGLRIDPARFDFDLDGLAELSERAAGTDPRRFDTDGDGASDGHEVRLLGTDPLDGAAPQLTAAQRARTRLAPTTMPDDWRRLHLEGPIAASRRIGQDLRVQGAADAVCGYLIDADGDLYPEHESCFDEAGEAIGPEPMPVPGAQLADDGACLFVERPEQGVVVRIDRDGTETKVFAGDSISLVAISCRVLFVTALDLTVTRVVDGAPFVVFDPTRACPVAGDESELQSCSTQELVPEVGRTVELRPLGLDLEAGAALFALSTDRGEALVAIDAARARVVLRAEALDPWRRLQRVFVEPGGRRHVLLHDGLGRERRLLTLNGAWAPLQLPGPRLERFGLHEPEGWFRGALSGTSVARFPHVLDPENPADPGCSACCACAPGVMICQPCAGIDPPSVVEKEAAAFAAWVPVEEGARPGETLFFSTSGSGFTLEQWGLYRSTAAGAIVPLIEGPAFVAAIAEEAARAALWSGAPGAILELQPDSTGRKLCLIDAQDYVPDGERTVWELTLDEQGLPGAVHHVATGDYTGCAYDADGRRALLTRDGAVTLGGVALPIRAGGEAHSLAFVGDRFIARAGGGILCFDAAGTVTGAAAAIDAFAPGPSGTIFFVSASGVGEVATIDGFCAGDGPRARLHDAETIYDAAEFELRFTDYSVFTRNHHLAVRPDGIVLVQAGDTQRTEGPAAGLMPPPSPLFRLRPTFEPLTSERIAALEPYRRNVELGCHHTADFSVAGGMATLPGGDATTFAAADGWPNFGLAPERLEQPGPGDGGGGGAGGSGAADASAGGDSGGGCGCHGGGGGLSALALALALLAAARRSRGAAPFG